MKNSLVLKIVLVLSGLLAIIVGSLSLFVPAIFHSSSGIVLGNNVGLLSEMRSIGGLLLTCGFVIMSGLFFKRLTFTATLVSAMVYLSYGLSRLYALGVDGIPNDVLLVAMAIELILGMASLLVFFKYQGS